MKPKAFILSLGGSLVIPEEKVDVLFLKKFRNLIISLLRKGYRIIIVVGGGSINKKYNKACKKIAKVKNVDLDWLGISATKLNAELLRSIFSKYAYREVLSNPQSLITLKEGRTLRTIAQSPSNQLIIASGWKPGSSSDLDAVLWAKRFKANTVINLTDVDYVYDKDPDVNKSAKPIKKINWNDFIKIIGRKWSPRGSWPFDPIASQLAQKLKINVVIVNGRKLQNLKNYIQGKKFKGTLIK